MTTLGIFTVKFFCYHEGRYYTYGGFGSYLNEIRKYFPKTILVAHVADEAPRKGFYEIDLGDDLEIVHLLPAEGPIRVTLTIPRMIRTCYRAAKRMDIVHARMPDYTGVIGALICKRLKIPVFCQIVDDWFVFAGSIPWYRKCGLGIPMKGYLYVYDWFERIAARKTLVFAQGRTAFEKHKGHADAVFTISTAHQQEQVIQPTEKFQGKPYTILNVARLNGVKNQELILRVLKRLIDAGESWKFVHVGEGNQRKYLESLTEKLGLSEHVEFHGKVPYGDPLWKYFDRADVFVLSSRSEGTPKVILEALARGLPVVASAVSGVPDTIADGERGLLFEDNDLEQLLEQAKRMQSDVELRGKCQKQGCQFAIDNAIGPQTKWTIEQVKRYYPDVFEKKDTDA